LLSVVVNWSFDSGDSSGQSPSSSIASYKKLAQSYPKPQLALNHEVKLNFSLFVCRLGTDLVLSDWQTYKGTAEKVMPQVVPMLINKGYELVTVAECLGVSPYQSVGKASKRDSSWTCDGKPQPGQ